jgi:ADP-ribosylation factor protein 6
MTPQEVQERLKLSQLKDKIWYVVPSCATTGEGLFEGLVSEALPWVEDLVTKISQGWLSNNVKTAPQQKASK